MKHHYLLIPYTYLDNVNPNKDYGCTQIYYQVMNSTNTTGVSQNPLNPLYATTQGVEMDGYQGYYGSDMYQIHLPVIANNMRSLLGDHMLQFSNLVSMSMNLTAKPAGDSTWTGMASNWKWDTTYITLMNEIEVYGCRIWGSSGRDIGIGCNKLPLFNFVNHVLFSYHTFWLRDVASNSYFCNANRNGLAGYDAAASDGRIVRPIILIN